MDGARPSYCDLKAGLCLPLCFTRRARAIPVYQRPEVDHPFFHALSRLRLAHGVPFLRRAVRMGQHVWMLLATIVTELLVITKWSKGQFPEPLPSKVKWGWSFATVLVVLYPIVQVSV